MIPGSCLVNTARVYSPTSLGLGMRYTQAHRRAIQHSCFVVDIRDARIKMLVRRAPTEKQCKNFGLFSISAIRNSGKLVFCGSIIILIPNRFHLSRLSSLVSRCFCSSTGLRSSGHHGEPRSSV